MNDAAVRVMFESLSHIMNNQQKIMRHLGTTKHDSDYGYGDNYTEELITSCDSIASEHKHDDEKW